MHQADSPWIDSMVLLTVWKRRSKVDSKAGDEPLLRPLAPALPAAIFATTQAGAAPSTGSCVNKHITQVFVYVLLVGPLFSFYMLAIPTCSVSVEF